MIVIGSPSSVVGRFADIAKLRNAKIAIMGSTDAAGALLKQHGVESVEVLRRRPLPPNLADCRVLCLLHSVPRMSWEDIIKLR